MAISKTITPPTFQASTDSTSSTGFLEKFFDKSGLFIIILWFFVIIMGLLVISSWSFLYCYIFSTDSTDSTSKMKK